MSRIRTIKPDMWTSEQVVSCSLNARLLFIGMWNFCDDNGIHPASYVRIKAEVFPCDNFQTSEIQSWINELIQQELIREYMIDEKAYWIVTGWKKHQKIDRPTHRHPLPQSELKKIIDNSTSAQREIVEHSLTSIQNIDEISPPEGNGTEGIGKEINIHAAETSPADTNQSSSAHEIFEYWKMVMHHPHAKLDEKRKRKIKQALNMGYALNQLKQAIDGCSKTAYNMGKNDSGQRYDDITLIFRDAEHIERFMRNAESTHKEQAELSNWALEVITS